jgi:hypothetical protein
MLSVLHGCFIALAPTPNNPPCIYTIVMDKSVSVKSSLFSTPSTYTYPALARSSASARQGRHAFLHLGLHVLIRLGVLGRSVMLISTLPGAEYNG